MKFGISQFTTWPWSFETDLAHYPQPGIEGIEICEFKLDRNDYEPQLKAVAACGLHVTSVQTSVHSVYPDSLAPQPTAPADRMRHIVRGMKRIAPHVPPGTPFVVITGAAPNGDTAQVLDVCQTSLYELAAYAEQCGMQVAFEPLNPVLFNTDTALWGLDDALDLVRRVDHAALGLCCDTWNIFQTPRLHDVIRASAGLIRVVQLSDWRRPRSGADRISLGKGSIPNAEIIRTLRTAGFDGPYVLEIFSAESLPDSIWRSDLEVVLRENAEAFAHLWKESTP